jgi:hypothetical protein
MNKAKINWWMGSGGSAPVSQVSPDLFETVGVPTDLVVPTYDANANTTHPDIIYRPLGWNGYKWWMIHTPYPAEARENPSIEVSNDADTETGNTWIDPPGLVGGNPIVPNVGGISPYNSDVDLEDRIDDEGKIICIYRWSDSTTTKFYSIETSNGINWGNTTLFLSVPDAGASPTIVYRNGVVRLWYVDVRGGNDVQYGVRFRQASGATLLAALAGLQAAAEQTCTISVPATYHNWHLKVRYDDTYSQYVMCMCFTLAHLAAPNDSGILSMGTSLDGLTWTMRTTQFVMGEGAAYRSTFVRDNYAVNNGAAYTFYHTYKWRIRKSLIWAKTASPPAQVFDGITTIGSYYGLFTRLSNWYGLPTCRVKRASDSIERDIFCSGFVLSLSDGTTLTSWLNATTGTVTRLYNQKGGGDYLAFNGAAPAIESHSDIWDSTTRWTMNFNGSSTVLQSYLGLQTTAGYTVPISLQSGRFVTTKDGIYFGLNGSNITLLDGANIAALHIDFPQIYTGIYGASSSAYIKRNSTTLITGSTTVPTVGTQIPAIGAGWTGAAYANFFGGKFSEICVWNAQPSAPNLATVENQYATDYPYSNKVILYDSYTDTNGVLITAHNADTRPGSNAYTANDALWQIQSNKLTRISAGSASPIPMCHIDTGVTDGYTEGILNPSGTGGSGLIFKYVDDNNLCYIRLLNNVTLGVIRYVAGALQTPASATISAPGKPFTLRVEQVGTSIKIFVNPSSVPGSGTPDLSYTESNFGSATARGWACATSEPASTFEDLRFTKW